MAGRKKKASGAGTRRQPAAGGATKTAAIPAQLATTLPPELSRLSASAPPFTPCIPPDAAVPSTAGGATGAFPGPSSSPPAANTAFEAVNAALQPAAAKPAAAERPGKRLLPATAGQEVLQQAVAAAPTALAGAAAAPAAGLSGGGEGDSDEGGIGDPSSSLPAPPGGPRERDSSSAGSTHSARGSDRAGSLSAGAPAPGPGDGSFGHGDVSASEGLAVPLRHGGWDAACTGVPNGGGPTRGDADVTDGGGRGLTAPLLPGGSDDTGTDDAGTDDSPIAKGFQGEDAADKRAPWAVTVATLLSLSLGWGLWLMPQGFARLGWLPAACTVAAMAAATVYSGFLISRLCRAVPDAVIFGDIGDAALGRRGRSLSYAVIYATDATRCIILHLAATQALQAAVARPDVPLLVYGLAIAGAALVCAQVRSLAELGWFLSAGTVAQLVALALVAWGLLAAPEPGARTRLVVGGGLSALAPALVAVMNMIFAFGGQFAFVEIITAMRRPREFPAAVGAATPLMAALYLILGGIGYWARGEDAPELIIFGMGTGPVARAASAAILLQALAQYLVNLNVWTHNILTLVARRRAGLSAAGRSLCDVRTACDHARAPWALVSTGVVAYSCAVALALPFFSTLVGLMSSVTYLTCAYTLPAWFTLLLVPDMPPAERAACKYVVIPLSLVLSVAGFCASAADLAYNLGGGPAQGRAA